MTLDPDAGRCTVGSDPRLSLDEQRAIAGRQYVAWPYMPPRSDGQHLKPPAARSCPCCRKDPQP